MKFELKHRHTEAHVLSRQVRKGFTLIELLISMTITLVIVGLLMGMTKMAVGAWQKTSSKARSSSLAQEVLASVGKDLEGMVIRSGNDYEWLYIKESDNSPTENGPDSNKEISNPIEVSFFTAATDRYNGQINVPNVDKGGDISMVRYRLIHQDQIEANGTKPVFSLYRERIDPDVTFDNLLAQTAIDGLIPSSEIVNRQNYLAENIFDFTLSFNFEFTLNDSTKAYRRVVVQSNGVNKTLSITGNKVLVNNTELTVPNASSARLAGADISILVLSDGGMNSLKTKPITSPEDLSKFLLENGQHYSKTVILPQP